MRLGLVARADNTGLGVQTWEFYRAFKDDIAMVLVVDLCHLSPKNLTLHADRYINDEKTMICQGFLDPECISLFLDHVDIVYTAETPYNYTLFTMAEERGIKTILHVNAEFNDYVLSPDLPRPSVFAAPTTWMWDSIPEPKVHLPVPVALDRFKGAEALNRDTITNGKLALPPQEQPGSQGLDDTHTMLTTRPSFLHVVGHPAVHDRNGTRDLLAAIPFITQACNITIKTQDASYFKPGDLQSTRNVNVLLDTSSPDNYWDIYRDSEGNPYDLLILPRRYGGLCLPMNEALAAGMPVIMPNIPPNNDQLPSEWLVPVRRRGEFMAKQQITFYRCRPRDLAAAIDDFAQPDEAHSFMHYQKRKARALAEVRSWDALRDKYLELFHSLLTREQAVR